MENKELLEMVRSKAQSWLTKSYDAETRAQVQALLDNEDPTEYSLQTALRSICSKTFARLLKCHIPSVNWDARVVLS